MWPLLLRAGAEIPHGPSVAGAGVYHPYITRVRNAGGFKKYAQNHLAAMTKLFAANGRRLPPEVGTTIPPRPARESVASGTLQEPRKPRV